MIFDISTLRRLLDKALDDAEHRWATAEDLVVELKDRVAELKVRVLHPEEELLREPGEYKH